MNVDNLHQPESSYSSFLNSEKLVMVHHNICLRAARGIVRVAFLPIAYFNSKDTAIAVFICLKSGKVLFQCRHGMVISVSYSILGCSYGAGASIIISRGINFNPETRKKILITQCRTPEILLILSHASRRKCQIFLFQPESINDNLPSLSRCDGVVPTINCEKIAESRYQQKMF